MLTQTKTKVFFVKTNQYILWFVNKHILGQIYEWKLIFLGILLFTNFTSRHFKLDLSQVSRLKALFRRICLSRSDRKNRKSNCSLSPPKLSEEISLEVIFSLEDIGSADISWTWDEAECTKGLHFKWRRRIFKTTSLYKHY